MKTLLQAIATMEGFYIQGSRPQRNNNPGDLLYCSESVRFGAIGSDGRFAIFPDVQTGFDALAKWLSIPAKFDAHGNLEAGYMGAALHQLIFRFAPPNENNTSLYVDRVSEMTGIEPDDIVTVQMLGADSPNA